MLDEYPEFGAVKARFDGQAERMWHKSIRFFKRWDGYLRSIRNDFGGHFGYPPGWFAVNHLNFRLMFRLALAGFGHAARCAQILAAYDLWPRFNP